MARPVLANLGFVLQIAGILMILPIIVGFFYGETKPLISLFITSFVFFASGFVFNAFSVRESMGYKSSCILISSVFLLLSLVGSIPYMYTGTFSGDLTEKFTDSFFESVSGYTTTGFSFIQDVDHVPKSIVFYRSLTQWIGGIAIVFVLLAFFYPESDLIDFAKALGIIHSVEGIKKTLTNILFVYTLFAIVFLAIFIYLVFPDAVSDVSLIFSTIATGGFAPLNSLTPYLPNGGVYAIIAMMLIGATNFFVLTKLLKLRLREMPKTELVGFIAILLVGTVLFARASNIDLTAAFFHVTSASSTTGLNYIDLSGLNNQSIMIMTFIMFVGGMSLSTSGGIKIMRLAMFLKAIPWMFRNYLEKRDDPLVIDGVEHSERDVLLQLAVPMLAIMLVFVSAFIFTEYGFPGERALFDTVSAFATTGLSTGVMTISLPMELKFWTMFLMIVGRIEIVPLLISFLPARKAIAAGQKEETYEKHGI